MALAEGATDFEFLADGEGLLRTYNLEFPDTAALTTLQRNEVDDFAKIILQLAIDELGELLAGVGDFPTVEIDGFLIVIVEHLRENLLVGSAAVRIVETNQIRFGRIFPAILELFGFAATALREAGIANLTIVSKNLSERLADGICHMLVVGLGDTLVALAMVVGTHIEDGMVFAIVPADEFIVFLDEREETVVAILVLAALFHLGKQPRARDNRMGLEELGRCSG